MSDWGWVTVAYVLVYGGLIAYVISLVTRTRRAKDELARR
jgi:D-alanyl-lipoteichoic acid acyltransferase DltB (MBOAT superfamily)